MKTEKKGKIIQEFSPIIISVVQNFHNQVVTHDWEELYQEVITHLANKLEHYDPARGKLSTYVYIVSRNKCLNMIKSPKNTKEHPVEYDEEMANEMNEIYSLTKQEWGAWQVAMDMLENHSKKHIIKRIMNGVPIVVVASDEGVSHQYVSKVWRDFIKDIKEELK